MVVTLHLHYIEFLELTDSQLDYLNSYGTFKSLYADGNVHRLYGDPQNLYTALLLIAKKYSIEILAQ